MTFNGHFELCFKMHAFRSLEQTKMKIDPYYQHKRSTTMTAVSGGYSRGFLGDKAKKISRKVLD